MRPTMGPDYNRIILVYKTDTPFLAQNVTTFRKIASERGILLILTIALEASHCGTTFNISKMAISLLQSAKHNNGKRRLN